MEVKAVKLEPDLSASDLPGKNCQKTQLGEHERLMTQSRIQESDENRSSNALSTGQSSSCVLEQGHCSLDDNGVSSTSTICPAPICRQFWKAGNYDDAHGSKVTPQNGKNFLHVHPLFLHSNATSHKWAFGAIAELLDNAVDEIQNGATFVILDKVLNPRDGTPALLIQDDGGGMDPEALRQCMSFGFSDKKSLLSIGQYGNGFKTSTMRLGADVIVFSSRLNNSVLTRSIGLLSYSFLTRTGLDRIAVPMVDYEFSRKSGNWEISHRYGEEHFTLNLSLLLQWSPYSTEIELLNQFDDIGEHGTKIMIYNLWFSDDGKMELDFDSDPMDIRISGDIRKVESSPACRAVNEQHIANRLHYSLRAYLSVLYLKLPETFSIALRGIPVEHHNLAKDLKFVECILYRPQIGGCTEAKVITTIGFLKEAPQVNIHGFNVYHKNRLILPFWQVVNYADSRGRGVVGVLEANFVEPTHNKQDFERTSLFQRLEVRLKEMTWEYWDYHCGLIGYHVKKKIRATEPRVDIHSPPGGKKKPVPLNQNSLAVPSIKTASLSGLLAKRKEYGNLVEPGSVKRQAGTWAKIVLSGHSSETQAISSANELKDQEAANLMEENKKLRARCLDYDTRRKELEMKVTTLRNQLNEVQQQYDRLTVDLASLDVIKEEKNVDR